MDDSGAILCQISYLKDMLDQVNEEVEANIQLTREIESEIEKCSEIENLLVTRESDLTKVVYMLQFDIHGLSTLTADSRASVKKMEEELHCLRMKRDDLAHRLNNKRDDFITLCLDFQREIEKGANDEVIDVLSTKALLEDEICVLDEKNYGLRNSVLAFLDEILEDLHSCNSALSVEIQSRNRENDKLLKDIDDLKTTLISIISSNYDQA